MLHVFHYHTTICQESLKCGLARAIKWWSMNTKPTRVVIRRLTYRSMVMNTQVIPVTVKQKTKWELLCIMDHEIKLYQEQHPNRVITKEIRNRIIVNVLKEEKQVIGLYKVQEFSYAFSLHFDTETFLDALNDSMKC